MVEIILNGTKVEIKENTPVLQVARDQGIDIPTLCYHEALGPYGSCRLCVVEAEGPMMRRQLIASCTLQVFEGLSVETHTPLVLESRKVIFELLLGRASDCEPLQELAGRYGVHSSRFPVGEKDPCVRCALCIRVCQDTLGVSALCFAGRGQKKRVTAEFGKLSETCIGCGTCANICPTRAIQLEDQGEKRRIFLKDLTVSEHTLLKCRICGVPFQPQKFIDFVTRRLEESEEGAVERDICPSCARRFRAEKIIGEIPIL
jgi:NADH dehydrogenase/NADH:ubiquinone oxidoreductase subunit G